MPETPKPRENIALNVGDLRKILADPSLPDHAPVSIRVDVPDCPPTGGVDELELMATGAGPAWFAVVTSWREMIECSSEQSARERAEYDRAEGRESFPSVRLVVSAGDDWAAFRNWSAAI